jgi:hypothetical protein
LNQRISGLESNRSSWSESKRRTGQTAFRLDAFRAHLSDRRESNIYSAAGLITWPLAQASRCADQLTAVPLGAKLTDMLAPCRPMHPSNRPAALAVCAALESALVGLVETAGAAQVRRALAQLGVGDEI